MRKLKLTEIIGLCGFIMLLGHAFGALTNLFQTPVWYQFVLVALLATNYLSQVWSEKQKQLLCPHCGKPLVSTKPKTSDWDTKTVG